LIFDNPDFSKLDLKQLAEELKNFGKTLVSAEDVIRKAQAGESLAGARLGTWTFPARICAGQSCNRLRGGKPNWLEQTSRTQICQGASFVECDLAEANLSGTDLSRANMVNASGEKAIFRGEPGWAEVRNRAEVH